MSNSLFLQTLRTAQNGNTLFDTAIDELLHNRLTKAAIDELLEDCSWHGALVSPEKTVENWKELLTLNLLHHYYIHSEGHSEPINYDPIRHKVYAFERHPWNQSSQYFRVIVALNHRLANLPVPDVQPHLLKGGAALIELQEYCPWLALPSIPHHLEFGIFLCALALLTQNEELKKKVIDLADWQINTIDAHGKPFSGLYVKEVDNDTQKNLVLYYLLFKGVNCLAADAKYQAFAHKMQSQIQAKQVMNPLWILLEHLFKNEKFVSTTSLPLPELIFDPSTALMGYRSQKQHAVCTLHGNKTGLGTYRLEDVEIVNYGPQYLPLGECEGFGIEGNHFSDQGERVPVLQSMPQGFVLKGCTRMIDQPAANKSFFSNLYRGIWLEVTQEFKLPSFHLKTSLLGLDGWDGVAFSFFVKARKCHVAGANKVILPKSFDRYEGPVQEVILEGEKTRTSLKSPDSKATMQIIPLAGGQDFWGADFLVAYLFHPDQRHYDWHVGGNQGVPP